ncbi:MAG: ABC transporter transmembrane domain-containing protein [Actinocrinis sp.]
MRHLPVPDPGEPDARSATRYLLWLVRNQRATIVGGMLFGVVWMVSQALMPAVIGRTIDAGITRSDHGALLRWSALVLVLGATTAASGIMRHRNALVNFLAAGYTTVQVVTRKAVSLGATLPLRVAAGDVVAVGTSDIAELGGGLDVTARLAGAIVAIIAVAVIMLVTSVPLGLIVLIGVPVLTAFTGFLLRPLHERQRRYRARQGELTARAIDIAAGLRVLRGIGGEAAFAQRYRRESQGLRGAAVEVTRVESGLAAVEVLMPGVIVVGVTFLAARFAVASRLSVGDLVAFYGYAAFLATPLRTLMEAADNVTRAHVAARRVVRILNLDAEIVDPEQPQSPPPGAVLADSASGLRIAPGALFAIACADPADADTLSARLARFEDSGAPTLGGVPLARMSVSEVRQRVLLARNSDHFFTGTLREELDPAGRATDADIRRAIDIASARDAVDPLPDGLDTEVVDGGRTFSGGQLQRLRLARALLATREITILVEPTSAVDAHTEARIADRLAGEHARGDARGHAGEQADGRGVRDGLGHRHDGHGRADDYAVVAASDVSRGASWNGGSSQAATAVATRAAVNGDWPSNAQPTTTVVFTTSPLLLDRAHQVAFIEGGRAVAVGTHRELLASEPRYTAAVTRGEDEG